MAFIYASDDMPWGKKNLKGIKDLHFLGAGQNLDKERQKEIVDPDAAVYDFALLVNCNHTLITRGTYARLFSFVCPQHSPRPSAHPWRPSSCAADDS